MTHTSTRIANLRRRGTRSSTPKLLEQVGFFATLLYLANTLERRRTHSALKHMWLHMMINMVVIVLNQKICSHRLFLASISTRWVRESACLTMDLCLALRASVGCRDHQGQPVGLHHRPLRTDTLVHRRLIYHLVLLLHNQVHTEADTKDSFHVNTFQTLVALALDALTIPFTFYGLNSQVSLIIDDTFTPSHPFLNYFLSYACR